MSDFLRRVHAIARKELRHVLREPRTLLIVFVQPVMLLLIYGTCISFDLRQLAFAVWDQDDSEASRQLVVQLTTDHQGSFALAGYVHRSSEVDQLLASGRVRFVLVIPRNYGREIAAGRSTSVQALFEGVDSNTAGVAAGYLTAALADYNLELAAAVGSRGHGVHPGTRGAGGSLGEPVSAADPISLSWRVFYNPDLSSRRFIIPGVIAILLTFLAATLTSTTITRERELGPLEALLTSPLGPADLVLGKMAPYVAVAAGNIALVVLVGGLVFGVWPRGDLFALASFSLLFLLGMLAVGMLISAFAPTQHLALLFSALSTSLPALFLTGFIFPLNNMPGWVRAICWPLPATQYLIAVRGIFLKGTGWGVLWPQGLWMGVVALVLVGLAIRVVSAKLARGLE